MEKKAKEEFWSSLLTEKSWQALQELKKECSFILIGGWAIYLLTKQKKSKGIDIVVDIKELQKLKQQGIKKNGSLKKYEIKKQEIDIDIYVEYFSKLAIPVEDIKNYTINLEGFTISSPELLLILKQSAYKERENSVKGEKDKIDIASLFFFSDINLNKYKEILKKYKIDSYYNELKTTLKSFKDYNSLNLNPRQFKLKKNKILSEF